MPAFPTVRLPPLAHVPLETVALPLEPVPLPIVAVLPVTMPPAITSAAESPEPGAIVVAAAAWLMAPPEATESVPVVTVVPPV